MLNKVLVVVVTRNNPTLLKHSLTSIDRYDAGYDYDLLIIDHESTDKKHLEYLSTLNNVQTKSNNRVEASFDLAWRENRGYKYYLFLHDDFCVNRNNWLKVFIDRMSSGYIEDIAKDIENVNKLPIGRVGAQGQYWRSYSSVLGYPIQCLFLEKIVEKIYTTTPSIFKYCDCDRVMVSNDCLKATGGLISVNMFRQMKEENFQLYNELCDILNKYLTYFDEGIPPRDKYPAGECWNKFCLTAELLNSVAPLISGYRTVSLEGDGFLENIHGYDDPWGSNYIHHYGSPNFKQFIAKKMNTDKNEISKHLNNKAFLLKCDKLIKEYRLEGE